MKKITKSRIWHKLFKCPTFWQLKPAFSCPLCGKTYRCYWDGNDIEDVGVDVCNECATPQRKKLYVLIWNSYPRETTMDLFVAQNFDEAVELLNKNLGFTEKLHFTKVQDGLWRETTQFNAIDNWELEELSLEKKGAIWGWR